MHENLRKACFPSFPLFLLYEILSTLPSNKEDIHGHSKTMDIHTQYNQQKLELEIRPDIKGFVGTLN